MNIQKRVQNLPNEIQYIILSYTYSPQPKYLLEDMQNYFETREYLYEIIDEVESQKLYYFTSAKDEIHNEICNFIYYYLCDGTMEMISKYIWRRYIMYKLFTNKHISELLTERIYNYTIDSQIRIFWGILLPNERNKFLDLYISDYDELFEEEDL